MSAMRSASSTTTMRTSASTSCALLDEVLEASGTGDEDVDAAPQRALLFAVADAAVHGGDAGVAALAASGCSTRATCAASSRVGTSTSAVGRFGALCVTLRPAMTSPKARVLPEPVGARPQMSRPARPSGSVAAWIGNGVVDALAREHGHEVGGHAEIGKGGTRQSKLPYFWWDFYGPQIGGPLEGPHRLTQSMTVDTGRTGCVKATPDSKRTGEPRWHRSAASSPDGLPRRSVVECRVPGSDLEGAPLAYDVSGPARRNRSRSQSPPP